MKTTFKINKYFALKEQSEGEELIMMYDTFITVRDHTVSQDTSLNIKQK